MTEQTQSQAGYGSYVTENAGRQPGDAAMTDKATNSAQAGREAASEVAQKGVRVNCVMPGVIETPLLIEVIEQLFDGDVQKGLDKLGQVATLNRCGKPSEVGNVVSFLLSDEASYVNGAQWEIDGGALATIRNDV